MTQTTTARSQSSKPRTANPARSRRLIEDWLPIAAIGAESLRERRSMTALPPTYYLHVWWARRPLVASRAAVMASLLPADADRNQFLETLGIDGDPVEARRALARARADGHTIQNPYGYPRAFLHTPTAEQLAWIEDEAARAGARDVRVLDPMAGGGSIPLEALRLGCATIAGDLNPVAWLVLKATVEWPQQYGQRVVDRFAELAALWRGRMQARLAAFYPQPESPNARDTTYLWAHSIPCPGCGGLIPLSPNWKLAPRGDGVRLCPEKDSDDRWICRYEIVTRAADHSPGTIAAARACCPFPGCGKRVSAAEIKRLATAGRLGQQLFTVVTQTRDHRSAGRGAGRMKRAFRAPRTADDVSRTVGDELSRRMPGWLANGIVPDETYPREASDRRPRQYGMPRWRDMFAPRQLLGHAIAIEVFQQLHAELSRGERGRLQPLDRAALGYLALTLDKLLNYNAYAVRWHSNRAVVAGVFDRHDYSFKWSYAEMNPLVPGLGFDWAIRQTAKAAGELVKLLPARPRRRRREVNVLCGSAERLDLPSSSIDAIVCDPPYFDNVMYAELADFFYVWLKRTAGLLYPREFAAELTSKDAEAVARRPRGAATDADAPGQAAADYGRRMTRIFAECRRVLRPGGVLTVMFTHKTQVAWAALARAILAARMQITASWPISTEAEDSLHIKGRAAAGHTTVLVCRKARARQRRTIPPERETFDARVAAAVRERIEEFRAAGLAGLDLVLACYGPALAEISAAALDARGRSVRDIEIERALAVAEHEVECWCAEPRAKRREVH